MINLSMSIVDIAITLTHVWSNEHPLRQVIVREILLEEGEVLNIGSSCRVGRNRIVDNQRAAELCLL